MKAVWSMDYDYHTDETYNRPSCPECQAPVGKEDDGKFYCYSCGGEVIVEDADMLQWLTEMDEERVEMRDCPRFEVDGMTFGCGGIKCRETHYHRNPVSRKWQTAWSQCKNCGARTIV